MKKQLLVAAVVNDRLSGTVRGLSRKTTSDSYATDLTWGFLKAPATS